MKLTYRGCAYDKKPIDLKVVSTQEKGKFRGQYCVFQRNTIQTPKEKLDLIYRGIHGESEAAPESIVRFLGRKYEIRTIFLEPSIQ